MSSCVRRSEDFELPMFHSVQIEIRKCQNISRLVIHNTNKLRSSRGPHAFRSALTATLLQGPPSEALKVCGERIPGRERWGERGRFERERERLVRNNNRL